MVDNEKVALYPVSLAMDGMAITPGLSFDARQGLLLGTTEKIDLADVKSHQTPNYEEMKKTFITEVESMIVTTLDGKFSMPVGLNFCTKNVTGIQMAEKIKLHKEIIETCLACLETCSSVANVVEKTNCDTRVEHNYTNDELHVLPPCQSCANKGSKCVRVQVVVFAADCEEKKKKAMEKLSEENVLAIPEAVHTVKRLRGSFGNWWLICGDTRINLSMIRTARQQNNILKSCIPLDAVRQKDRMDVDSCLQISQDSVRKVLNKYSSISQVIVPEKYRLWETNRPGVLSCPVGISMLDISQYFVLDAAGNRFLMKLHYPAEMTLIDDSLVTPLGVVYLTC